MKKNIIFSFILILLFITCPSAFASNSSDVNQLVNMSLEDLMNLNVEPYNGQ